MTFPDFELFLFFFLENITVCDVTVFCYYIILITFMMIIIIICKSNP